MFVCVSSAKLPTISKTTTDHKNRSIVAMCSSNVTHMYTYSWLTISCVLFGFYFWVCFGEYKSLIYINLKPIDLSNAKSRYNILKELWEELKNYIAKFKLSVI